MGKKQNGQIREHRGRSTHWIHLGRASLGNLKSLAARFPMHEHDLRELLPSINHTKCIVRHDYIFMVFVFPVYDNAADTIRESELSVFVNKDTLVTVNHENTLPDIVALDDDMSNAVRREMILSLSPADVLLALLDRIYRSTFPLLVEFSQDIHDLENRLFAEYDKEEMIRKVLLTKSGNARARNAIQNHRYVLKTLNSAVGNFTSAPLAHFDHVVLQTMDIWNTLQSQREAIDTIHETNETLLSYRTNNIMKTLTIFTSIFMPLGMITSVVIIETPVTRAFNDYYWSFPLVLAFMAVIASGMLIFFKKKRWI